MPMHSSRNRNQDRWCENPFSHPVRRLPRSFLAVSGAAVLLCTACNRDEPSSDDTRSEAREAVKIQAAGPRPRYDLPIELRTAHPDTADFVDRFLTTCLAGNYSEYRRMVSRTRVPESRERFEAIYRGLESVAVESIEPIDPDAVPELPEPAYMVVSRLKIRGDSRLSQRKMREQVAMIVFVENGDWRMIPAPASMQPEDEPETAAAPPEPAEPEFQTPYFPWDQPGW
jgi:hypothetical protein